MKKSFLNFFFFFLLKKVQKKEMGLKMEVQIKVVIRVEKREVLWKQIKPIKD
jgi:hypothetical protein